MINISVLKVMTLNLAHGRGDGRHQLLQSTDSITANLQRVIDLLNEYQPQIVALQEVDRVSAWNGRFDHFEHLASETGFEHCAHADHANRRGLSYGAGLLSKHELQDILSISFESTPPLPPKGFVVATIELDEKPIDVVSIHLDPTSRKRRASQADQAIAVLKARANPLIIMGDFNCDYTTNERNAIRKLRQELNLHAWKPHASGMATFKRLGIRFDWILISQELAFTYYQTVQQVVSDHYPVVAEVHWKQPVAND